MYKSIIFILIFLFCNYYYSQIEITLHNKSGVSIPSAYVSLYSKDGSKIISKVSNSEGKVFFNNSETKNITKLNVEVNSLGFVKQKKTITNNNSYTIILVESNEVLNQVVITAQYSENNVEKALHKVDIIDRKKIDAMGAVNLQDALSNSMGIRLQQDNILGSSISLQGISGENVKILIDGVPVIGRLNGNIDLSQINLENIDRIEIVKGPLSVNYGTNALAGAINLISKSNKKGQLEVGATSYYESSGKYNFTGNVGINKENNDILISGGRNYFDGWNNGDDIFRNPKPIADSTRFKSWKPKEQIFGGFQYGRKINNINIKYKGNIFNELIWNKGYPRAPYQENAFDDEYKTYRLDNSIFLDRKLDKYSINILASINNFKRIKNTYFTDLTNLKRILTENSGDQDTSNFNQFISRGTYAYHNDSSKLNYQIGYEINIEQARGRRIEGTEKQQGDYAIFASSEYDIKNFIFRPGVRYSYNTSYTTPLLPSLNIKYNYKNTTARLSYARGFRAPSLKELYFNFVDINHNIVGSKDLIAETSSNYIFTLSNNLSKNNLILKSEIGFFLNDIRNRISLAQTEGTQYTYVNIGEFKSRGLQTDFNISINNFKINIGASYIGRSNSIKSKDVPNFSFSPEFRGNIFYELEKQSIIFALFYKHQGKLPNVVKNSEGNIQTNYISSYNTSDFTITKKFYKNQLNFSMGVKNIFDVKNVSSIISGGSAHTSAGNSIPVAMGRVYMITLKANITKWKNNK